MDDRRTGHASADTQRDRDNGSRLYEVNMWMQRYGRGRDYRRGGEDQGLAAQREQDQGGRDEEASQRGRCRSGGGTRLRRSGLTIGTGL